VGDWHRLAFVPCATCVDVRTVRSETTRAARKADPHLVASCASDADTASQTRANRAQADETTRRAPDAAPDAGSACHPPFNTHAATNTRSDAQTHSHAATNDRTHTQADKDTKADAHADAASNSYAATNDCADTKAAPNAKANGSPGVHAATNANRRRPNETQAHNETLRQELRDETTPPNGDGHAARNSRAASKRDSGNNPGARSDNQTDGPAN